MVRLARSTFSRKRTASTGPSRIETAVMVDRSSGSFSMVHISISESLMRDSYRSSSAIRPPSAGGAPRRTVTGAELVLRGVAVRIGDGAGGGDGRALARLPVHAAGLGGGGVGGGVQGDGEARLGVRRTDHDAVGRVVGEPQVG